MAKKRSARRKFSPGQKILKQGEISPFVYLIKRGRVKIIRDIEGSKVELAQLTVGSFFGEMSVFTSSGAVGTAIAIDDVEVEPLSKEKLIRKIAEDGEFAELFIRLLCKRLRDVDEHLSFLLSQRALTKKDLEEIYKDLAT